MIESVIETLVGRVKDILRRVERLEAVETTSAGWVILPQASRLTSTAWDGGARSTTSSTKIDMSAVFGTPENIDAVLLEIYVKDSASQTTDCWFRVADSSSTTGGFAIRAGYVNDRYDSGQVVCPTDASGDIYYDCTASGTNTLDIIMTVRGYHLR